MSEATESWGEKKRRLEAEWAEYYNKVRDFALENGRLPKKYSRDNREQILCHWLENQKNIYFAHNMGNMNATRIKLLEELPFWSVEA